MDDGSVQEGSSMLPFRQQLILLVVQYLAIALLITVAGIFLERALAHYTSHQAVNAEIAKEQVKKLQECWALMYPWEVRIGELLAKAAQLRAQHAQDQHTLQQAIRDELAPLHATVQAQADTIAHTVEAHRFWIGEYAYTRLKAYHTTLSRYMHSSMSDVTLENIKTLEEQIKQAKVHARKALQELE